METFETLRHKASYVLTTLKDHPEMDGVLQIPVNFASYSSLFCTVNDLMKMSAAVMSREEPYMSH